MNHMKKYVAVCATLAALAWVGVAAAAAPQGQLTGSATLGIPFLGPFAIGAPVTDGGTSYIGLENDKSGNCNGDSGTIIRVDTFTVVCAHYVASSGCCNTGNPKMRFAFPYGGGYNVIRITDNGASPDTFAAGGTDTFAHARAWVNKGTLGCGCGAVFFYGSLEEGNFTITASQT
jgi:hypothetical protein